MDHQRGCISTRLHSNRRRWWATFENARGSARTVSYSPENDKFKYAEPSFQYDGVDINTAIRSKPSEHDCSAFGVVMILDFEGAQEIKPDIQTLYQVSMVAKQLQDIQSLIQYYQTYSDTHDEINKLYALEARAKTCWVLSRGLHRYKCMLYLRSSNNLLILKPSRV